MKTKKIALLWLAQWAEEQSFLKVIKEDFIKEKIFELHIRD